MHVKSDFIDILHSCDVLLDDMFLMFLLDNFKNDCVLWTLFLSTTEATKSVWKAFENYVTVLLLCFYCVVLLYIICPSLCLTVLFGE